MQPLKEQHSNMFTCTRASFPDLSPPYIVNNRKLDGGKGLGMRLRAHQHIVQEVSGRLVELRNELNGEQQRALVVQESKFDCKERH